MEPKILIIIVVIVIAVLLLGGVFYTKQQQFGVVHTVSGNQQDTETLSSSPTNDNMSPMPTTEPLHTDPEEIAQGIIPASSSYTPYQQLDFLNSPAVWSGQ